MSQREDVARERVAKEMDWWTDWLRAKTNKFDLELEEAIVCAILAQASLAERD